ncbi:MAG: hypothetical protein AAB116_09655 [Candidatus Poribacteria bacterium]
MKFRRSVLLFLLILWCFPYGLAIAGTFIDDFSDGKLGDKWFVTKKRATGKEITEADGILKLDSKGTDVVTGIRYEETFDLTKGSLIIECDYITGYQQTYISFNSFPSTTEAWDNQPMFIFIVVNGTYQFVGGGTTSDKPFTYSVGQDEWHHYKIELSPASGKKVPFKTTIDKGKFDADGKIDIASLDPTKVYVYFEVWTASGKPTSLDNISLTSPSIAGNMAVDKVGKLATKWGILKLL